jgi:hypothetical protein
MSRSIPTSPENGTESTSSAFLSSALLLANELAIPSCDSSRVFALAANSGRDGTPLFGAAAGVFIFPSRSLYRSLGRMNADRHRNEGYLFSLYLTFYPRLNCGTHPQFVLMKFSNAVAVGFTIVFSTGMVLPLRAADPPSDTERLQNLEKAVRQLQERNAEQFDELLLRLQVLF